jgi:AraC-like DNA-binding protein
MPTPPCRRRPLGSLSRAPHLATGGGYQLLCAFRDRVCKAREARPEPEILTEAPTVHESVERARTRRVRAVRRRCAHRSEQGREVGRFVVDHVVDAVRGNRGIEHTSDGLRNVDVVGDRQTLGRRKALHQGNHLLDVRIAVAVNERQPEHPHVEPLQREEKALGGELAFRVRVQRRARVVLASRTAAVGTVDQAGAGEDEALHGGRTRGGREVLRAEIVDLVRLLGRRATEEGGAVDHGIDPSYRGGERARVEQIAPLELDPIATQVGGARRLAHEGANLIASLGKTFGESTSDLSGRSGDEDLHARNLVSAARHRLEETDTRARKLARPRAPDQNPLVQASVAPISRIPPSAPAASGVAGLFVYESDCDMQRVSLPRPEIQLVVRFGPSAGRGLDVHAMGVRARVHRKLIRNGQRTVTARLHLGAAEAVLGMPASAIAGRIVPLEDLWGDAAARRLTDRLADARGMALAAGVLESAIAERTATADSRFARTKLALDAADRLAIANVNAVAVDLGVSERHLRRVFHETVGVSPKAFAKLARFRRALHAAREGGQTSWASIAAAAGYYDQAHLIAEFRAIAGVTPRALLDELRAAPPLG